MKKIVLFLSLAVLTNALFSAMLSGYVKNKANKETIPFANVILTETGQGVNCNEKGYYLFPSLKPGTYTVTFQMIGYETYKEKVTVGRTTYLDVELVGKKVQMQSVKVVGVKEKEEKFYIPVSEMKITPTEIKELPQVAEADLFRSMSMLPGIQTISDYSSGLYVRGGSPDQNQILMDGIDVYNPSHFMGFFSTFNIDAIKTVDLTKGGFEAKYGGRLSSVMNVYNLDGNRKKMDGAVNLSLVTSKATLSGPWSKGSWMVSGRRTYLELVEKMIGELPDYYFYDAHAKLNWDLSGSDFLQYSFYNGKDNLDMSMSSSDILLNWGNTTNVLKLNHMFEANHYVETMLAYSKYQSLMEIGYGDQAFQRKNELNDLTFKANFTYEPSDKHRIEYGLEEKFFKILFKVSDSDEQSAQDYPNVEQSSLHTAAYLMDNYKPSILWLIKYGARFDYYNEGSYFRVSPRLSVRYYLERNWQAYIAGGRYYQFVTLVGVPEFSAFDLFFPIDKSVKPLESDHIILGSDIDFMNYFSLNVETYYKDMRNLTTLRPEVDQEYNNDLPLDQVYNFGHGNAYGLDIMLKNDFFDWKGYISYSYAVTTRKFKAENEGLVYYPKFDRRHQININQNYYLGKYTFGTSFVLGTGQPLAKPIGVLENTAPDGMVTYNMIYGRADSDRLPSYNRFDFSVKRSYYYKKMTIEPYLQVTNMFKSKNINNRTYSLEDKTIKKNDTNMLPRIPTIGVNIKW